MSTGGQKQVDEIMFLLSERNYERNYIKTTWEIIKNTTCCLYNRQTFFRNSRSLKQTCSWFSLTARKQRHNPCLSGTKAWGPASIIAFGGVGYRYE